MRTKETMKKQMKNIQIKIQRLHIHIPLKLVDRKEEYAVHIRSSTVCSLANRFVIDGCVAEIHFNQFSYANLGYRREHFYKVVTQNTAENINSSTTLLFSDRKKRESNQDLINKSPQ